LNLFEFCENTCAPMTAIRLAFVVWIVGLLALPGLGAQHATAQGPAASPLPSTIPIFPLPEAMLFPNVSRPLHIFEPRYRSMIADALKGDRIIGMVTLKPGFEADYDGRPPIFEIGCAGLIASVQELPDGRFNVVLKGLVRFRVVREDNSRPYRLADVTALPEVLETSDIAALGKQRQRLEALLAASRDRFGFAPAPSQMSDADVVNTISQYLELDDPLDRQDLLERSGVLARSATLIDLIERIVKAPRKRQQA